MDNHFVVEATETDGIRKVTVIFSPPVEAEEEPDYR